jgi:hypothetical protein
MDDKNWDKYIKIIEPRVDKLLSNGFYFEIIFLFSNILEIELKDLIKNYQKICKQILNNEKIEHDPDNFFNPDDPNGKNTLGNLLRYSKIFIPNNILEEAIEFNKLRVETIHKIFDQDAVDLEGKIKKFIPRFYGLMGKLLGVQINYLDNFRKYINRNKK